MKVLAVVSLFLIVSVFWFKKSDAQALSPWGKIGLAALGGAVVDRTFSRQPTNNYYYYSYPGYTYTYGNKK